MHWQTSVQGPLLGQMSVADIIRQRAQAQRRGFADLVRDRIRPGPDVPPPAPPVGPPMAPPPVKPPEVMPVPPFGPPPAPPPVLPPEMEPVPPRPDIPPRRIAPPRKGWPRISMLRKLLRERAFRRRRGNWARPLRMGQGDMTAAEFVDRFEIASEIWKEAINLLGRVSTPMRNAIMERFGARDYKSILASQHDTLSGLAAELAPMGEEPISPDIAGQLLDFERRLDILLAELEGIPEAGRPKDFPWLTVGIVTALGIGALAIAGVFGSD